MSAPRLRRTEGPSSSSYKNSIQLHKKIAASGGVPKQKNGKTCFLHWISQNPPYISVTCLLFVKTPRTASSHNDKKSFSFFIYGIIYNTLTSHRLKQASSQRQRLLPHKRGLSLHLWPRAGNPQSDAFTIDRFLLCRIS